MHHKNKDTGRKRGRRPAHKGARAKTKRALEGTVVTSAARGDSWSATMPQPPILDVPSTRGFKAPKPKPKKAPRHAPCPNGQHEWYEEVVEGRDYVRLCPHEKERGYPYYFRRCNCTYWDLDDKTWFKTYVEKKTCIHCWRERIIKEWDDNPYSWERYWSSRKVDRTYGGGLRRKIRTQDTVSGMTVNVR